MKRVWDGGSEAECAVSSRGGLFACLSLPSCEESVVTGLDVAQVERNLEKHKNKRDDLDSIKQWRKGKDGKVKVNADKEEEMLEKSLSKSAGEGMKKKRLNDFIEEKTGRRPDEDDRTARKSHKRLMADKKFGRGGKSKTLSKRNTFESSHDMSSFNASRNNKPMPGMSLPPGSGISKGGRGGKTAGGKRAGKDRRNKQHSRRK